MTLPFHMEYDQHEAELLLRHVQWQRQAESKRIARNSPMIHPDAREPDDEPDDEPDEA